MNAPVTIEAGAPTGSSAPGSDPGSTLGLTPRTPRRPYARSVLRGHRATDVLVPAAALAVGLLELAVVRPEGVLWFGSAQMLERQVLQHISENPDAYRLVLHMERNGRVDLTASLVLAKLIGDARGAGLETEVIAIHPLTAKALHRVLRENRRSEGDRTAGRKTEPAGGR